MLCAYEDARDSSLGSDMEPIDLNDELWDEKFGYRYVACPIKLGEQHKLEAWN